VKQPIYKNSWRWTCKCPKHVEAIYENKIIVKLFASSWYISLLTIKLLKLLITNLKLYTNAITSILWHCTIYKYIPLYTAWRWLSRTETCCCELFTMIVNSIRVRLYLLLLHLLDYNTPGMPCLKIFSLNPCFEFNETLLLQYLRICQSARRNITKAITLKHLASSFGDQNS